MDNPEKLATYKCRVHKTKTNKTKTQHNMCWTPLYANKQTYGSINNCFARTSLSHYIVNQYSYLGANLKMDFCMNGISVLCLNKH
jgi:hypothetical protein